MKKLASMILMVVCLFSSAHAEMNVVRKGSNDSYYGNFYMVYDPQKENYWAMLCVERTIAGIVFPFMADYCVYRIDKDLKNISLEFSTKHYIDRMVPSAKGLVYTREVLFDALHLEVLCYHIASGKSIRVIPFRDNISLLGADGDSPLYYRAGAGLCCFDIEGGKEIILIDDKECNEIIAWDENALIYRNSVGTAYSYSFADDESTPINIPDGVLYISNGYMLDKEQLMLYAPSGNETPIDFIEGASSIALEDGYLCAFFPSSTGIVVKYVSVIQPGNIISVAIPAILDRNLNMWNGKVFFYTKNGKEITFLDLATASLNVIKVPQ